jgi:hypothetical protein
MRGLSNLTDSGRPQIDNYRIEVGSNQDEWFVVNAEITF